MAVNIIITLTSVGADASTEYDLFSNIDGFLVPYETGVTLANLQASYTSGAPNGTTTVRVCGTGPKCKSCIDIQATYTTTTTSTTTITPTTTTTTTTEEITTTTTTTFTSGLPKFDISSTTSPTPNCGLSVDTAKFILASVLGEVTAGDLIFETSDTSTPFIGNGEYYTVENAENIVYSVRINANGEVLAPITLCATTTTTTTTAPATTTTTTTNASISVAAISTTTDVANACGLATPTTVYINTGGNEIATGDIIYTDAGLVNPFVGNGDYYAIQDPVGGFTISAEVSSIGVVGSVISICP